MECAINARVPIHILNTFKIDSPGTVVDPVPLPGMRSSNSAVTAVVSKKGISVLNIASNRKLGSTTYIARVFDCFARHGVKIDLISTSETNLSITLHETTPEAKVRKGIRHEWDTNCWAAQFDRPGRQTNKSTEKAALIFRLRSPFSPD